MQVVVAMRERLSGGIHPVGRRIRNTASQCDHDRAHLRMNIAEDVGDALARKDNAACRARFIQSRGRNAVHRRAKTRCERNGSAFGNATLLPTGTTSKCGVNILFFLQQCESCQVSRACAALGMQGVQPDHGRRRSCRLLCASIALYAASAWRSPRRGRTGAAGIPVRIQSG
jgi:hypothetical protein